MTTIQYLSVADAAKILGLTPGGVRLMVRRRELPIAAQTEGGIHLFKRVDVERVARLRQARMSAELSLHGEEKD
jgi:hypothetical protein